MMINVNFSTEGLGRPNKPGGGGGDIPELVPGFIPVYWFIPDSPGFYSKIPGLFLGKVYGPKCPFLKTWQ